MNVTILYGGVSGEHEISLMSAAAIIQNISSAHHVDLVGITKSGKWYYQRGVFDAVRSGKTPLTIEEDPKSRVFIIPGDDGLAFCTGRGTFDTDVVFPCLHGTFGEDGTVQGLLECARVPYVGCDVLSSAISMDKSVAKRLVAAAGVEVVPYVCLTRAQINDKNTYDKIFEDAVKKLGFPLFVKPCNAGSSNGGSLVKNERQLSYALMEAFTWDNKVLVERALTAREIECSVTGLSVTGGQVKAYELGEIKPTHAFYDFDAKYNDEAGAALDAPAVLDGAVRASIMETAEKVYSVLGCAGLARVDFFIDKATGEVFFNEINTMPGFTKISMFPKLCACGGLSFSALIDKLLEDAISAHKATATLQRSR